MLRLQFAASIRTPEVAGAVRELIHSTPAPGDSWGVIDPRPTPRLTDNCNTTPEVAGAVRELIHSTPAPGDSWGVIDPRPTPRLTDNCNRRRPLDAAKAAQDRHLPLAASRSGKFGKSKAAQPVVVELKEGVQPVRIRQYPIKLEARKGVAPMIAQFLIQGILQECESEFNTPIFPVQKPNGKYRLVQDLRAINNITKDMHPVVANPYTLLTSVSERFQWFTVIDLKDAFFCIPLAFESRKYFAFEWEDPDSGRKKQLTWTRLPQGFKNSPTIFGNQLAKELEEWKTTQVKESPFSHVILQYVDDIFLATEERDICLNLTISLLNMLGQAGYRVSKEKAQLIRTSVLYLGCEITQGVRRLGANRIEAICTIPIPQNHQELRSFLGMVGWCRLWIPNFGLLAKPLYEALKETRLRWDNPQQNAFQGLKHALKEAPALGLPDLTKDFQLYVNERQRLALGVLTQKLGSWKRPVGYFSKQLDAVSSGWPSCLRAVAATVLLIQESRKLTLEEGELTHDCVEVIEQVFASRTDLKDVPLESPDWELFTDGSSFVENGTSEQEEGELTHDCVEVIEQVFASRTDLKDVPLESPDWELFTDGSSFVENGTSLYKEQSRSKEADSIRKITVHDIQPGDRVYVKNWSADPLKESWEGPRQVIMTTFTVAKVEGINNWIHYTRIKKVLTHWEVQPLSSTKMVIRAKPTDPRPTS
ncbi:uncharacterized protein LOC134043853 [Cinclus cinclus]|uniref:uncharacterized protein LOC134043853 n=1 Tax=Cinclus cinclus TaxID=127875 RepID=UPI002E1685F3